MTITKKDYELLAGVLREQRTELATRYRSCACGTVTDSPDTPCVGHDHVNASLDALDSLTSKLAYQLSLDNPRFNAERFMQAAKSADEQDVTRGWNDNRIGAWETE